MSNVFVVSTNSPPCIEESGVEDYNYSPVHGRKWGRGLQLFLYNIKSIQAIRHTHIVVQHNSD